MDTELRHTYGLILHRTEIAERLVEPLSILEHPNKLEHGGLGLLTGPEILVMDQLILERTEEAVDHSPTRLVASKAKKPPDSSPLLISRGTR